MDYGVAKFVLPEECECGDRHLISSHKNGVLIAAVDGIGHGREAANAAKTAISVLKERASDPITSLVERCHQRLRRMRGVVLSLASIHASDGVMAWLGVGNVQGVLMRAHGAQGDVQEPLLLRMPLRRFETAPAPQLFFNLAQQFFILPVPANARYFNSSPKESQRRPLLLSSESV